MIGSNKYSADSKTNTSKGSESSAAATVAIPTSGGAAIVSEPQSKASLHTDTKTSDDNTGTSVGERIKNTAQQVAEKVERAMGRDETESSGQDSSSVTTAPPPSIDIPSMECVSKSYKLRNDSTLTMGTLPEVLERTRRLDQYDPVLAHYLAYLCSLVADELTTPTYTLPNRLKWCEPDQVEYLQLDGGYQCHVLMMRCRERVILAFRGTQTWTEARVDLTNWRIASDRLIPHRLAVAELYRIATQKGELPPTLDRDEGERIFEMDPGSSTVHSGMSSAYRMVAHEVRSFVRDSIGEPLSFSESVRKALSDLEKQEKAQAASANGPGIHLRNRQDKQQQEDKQQQQQPSQDSTKFIPPSKTKIIITGHGIGGAVAQLCALDMTSLYGRKHVCCYTFGQPRLGNSDFATLWQNYGCHLFRVINTTDPIVSLPGQISGFTHPKGTRISYAAPPKLGREGFMGNREPHRNPLMKPILSISTSAKQRFRSVDGDLRIHTTYCGVSIPMKIKTEEPFSFVLRSPTTISVEQPTDANKDLPPRCELDLTEEKPPFDLYLRDVEPTHRASLKRRLQVLAGLHASPYSHAHSPAEAEVYESTEGESSDDEPDCDTPHDQLQLHQQQKQQSQRSQKQEEEQGVREDEKPVDPIPSAIASQSHSSQQNKYSTPSEPKPGIEYAPPVITEGAAGLGKEEI